MRLNQPEKEMFNNMYSYL